MTIPKNKYLSKVQLRLDTIKEMFSDRERVEEMMKRVGGFGKGSDFHNKLEWLWMFLDQDVPALLTALNESKEEIQD